MIDLPVMAAQCAPDIHPTTVMALVRVESAGNPFAIGVVGGALIRQPVNKEEAVATAAELERTGINYSVGLAQINRSNFARLGLTAEAAFDACRNLAAASVILRECYVRAEAAFGPGGGSLEAALSCYYSGNFQRGFVPEGSNGSYVERVVRAASGAKSTGKPVVQAGLEKSPVRLTAEPDSASEVMVFGSGRSTGMVYR